MSLVFLDALVESIGQPYIHLTSSTLVLYRLGVLLQLTSIYSSCQSSSGWSITIVITSSSQLNQLAWLSRITQLAKGGQLVSAQLANCAIGYWYFCIGFRATQYYTRQLIYTSFTTSIYLPYIRYFLSYNRWFPQHEIQQCFI